MSGFNESYLVLVLAPTQNDAAVTVSVLAEDGISATACPDVIALCGGIKEGCGAIVIAEEGLSQETLTHLHECLVNQEPWSDLPVILITGQGAPRSWEGFTSSGNISLLERPFSRLTLVRAVQVCLRARAKQYQVRQLLEQQKAAAEKRDEFFATLSHELRTPLNVILGWTEVLRNETLSPDAQADALKVLDRNAQMQKALIDDLLDTSRIITGKLLFDSQPLSLNSLLLTLTQGFGPKVEKRGLSLGLTVPATDCTVRGDEARLAQVVTNLLTNATKFTPEGGRIDVILERAGPSHIIRVRDTGQGMDASFLPYVFDRLKQEDMSTTRAHGGLGLGLAISSYIVEQHQGKIEARSEGRGTGSEFVVTLPALTETPAAVLPPTTVHEAVAKSIPGMRILVVDDSPDILTLIELWLKRTSAVVKTAQSAREALDELGDFKPHLLISDIGMPEMDGYELITRVRRNPSYGIRALPAIALTAYAKDEERDRILDAGFQMHISKPISGSQLLAAVYAATATIN